MSHKYCFVAIVFCLTFQGLTYGFDAYKLKNYFETRLEDLKDDLISAELGLKNHYNSLVHSEKSRISDAVHKAKQDIVFLSEISTKPCAAQANQELDEVKTTSLSDFIHCVEGPTIIFNIKEIAVDVVGMVEKIMADLKTGLNGLDDCGSFGSELSLKCINSFIWEVIDLVKDVVTEVNQTRLQIRNITQIITEEIADCSNNSSSVHEQVQLILDDFQDCSQ